MFQVSLHLSHCNRMAIWFAAQTVSILVWVEITCTLTENRKQPELRTYGNIVHMYVAARSELQLLHIGS